MIRRSLTALGVSAHRLAQRWAGRPVSRREVALLAAIMALAVAVVVGYLGLTRSHPLVGDEPEYARQATFFTEGMFWWSTTPFGEPHPTAWKAPIYPIWVGFWYSVLGESATAVELVQALLAAITVALTWLLSRRLFGSARAAIASAAVVAVFPFVFDYYALLYPEALAIPLTTAVLIVVLTMRPTRWVILGTGALMGLSLLLRPSSAFLFAGALAAWWVAAGPWPALARTAVAGVVAALVISPWTIRNALTDEIGPVPISLQDIAGYGTFNAEAANDPVRPYGWRPLPGGLPLERIVVESETESEFRSRLQDLGWDYVKDHPEALPKALFWNGLSRFWDVRRPARILDEAPTEHRSRAATVVGLWMHYLLLPLALAGLWLHRRRRELLVPVLALALAASLIFTVAAFTRYRAPLEPLIVVLAASVMTTAAGAVRRPTEPGPPRTGPPAPSRA